ncbi:acylamino-acid-releasing enzyme-like [Cylas formicarius]|uniref:acylamino-acid-releasing enzyme-like n=1 Tax=Cylas formicarius TaxID=197179 RepID=UPI0029589E54|nr:acylamino-acid-releasing enzyme-like [Cylas formicarius]XP_060528021.1 acylamino-acid-releasing enzyme-like [Cylas formicarius]XP_060528022.1 acylamino-acid-releasing enzyme-like [Cylas formicarius]
MTIMSSKLDKIVKTYKSLAQIPALAGAQIYHSNVINTVWSQRNLEKGKSTKFSRTLILNGHNVDETFPLDITSEILSIISESKNLRAVLRENDTKQFLEIWKNNNLLRCVDLGGLDIHGNVYSDGEFGSFEFSPDEKKLLYVAEKKPPKSEPFYKRKKPEEDGNGPKPTKGDEYVFEQDWGEQLVGKKKSVIAQYDIENDSVEILDGIPDNICIAQPKYSPDGLYIAGIAYFTEPRKLGLIYCGNRASTIFTLDFEGNYLALSLNNNSVKAPTFSPDGKTLLWLQRSAGGPHASGMALVKADTPLSKDSLVKTVVDIVPSKKKISEDKDFYGLYNSGFPKRCWATKNRLLLNTNQKYTINSYVVNVDNGEITELEFDAGSQLVIDVSKDTVLALRRNFLHPDQLVIGNLPDTGSENQIQWQDLTPKTKIPELNDLIYKYLDLSAPHGNVTEFNSIYLGPSSGNEKEIPLVVWPHGGPHSAFGNYLFLEAAMFLSMKYAILLVNYRGSLGSGEDSVQFLPGKVGVADVDDCIQATDAALKMFPWLNPEGLVLCGGSHGGFLVTMLSGMFPDKFKAVIARNPVIDIASMSITSDIPDWCYVEAGKEYTQKGELDDDLLLKMRRISPIYHAHKVKAPTLLQIGSKDLRVPAQQGNEYYCRLKTNGVNVKMNLYDDNHPLGSVPNEIDNIINTILWIEEHLGLGQSPTS